MRKKKFNRGDKQQIVWRALEEWWPNTNAKNLSAATSISPSYCYKVLKEYEAYVGKQQAHAVSHPPSVNQQQVGGSHYKAMPIQPWEAMQAWMKPDEFNGFLKGNAIKYLARCNAKGGLEAVKKAHHYIAKLIEVSK